MQVLAPHMHGEQPRSWACTDLEEWTTDFNHTLTVVQMRVGQLQSLVRMPQNNFCMNQEDMRKAQEPAHRVAELELVLQQKNAHVREEGVARPPYSSSSLLQLLLLLGQPLA